MPIKRWADVYGDEVKPLADALLNAGIEGVAIIQNPDLVADDTEINTHNVWKVKMEKAPGAFDIKRRIEVMDFMGVHRQIMYPGIAPIYAHALYNKADDPKVFRSITGDRKGYAYRLMDIYNDWCGRVSREQDRVRPTALLIDETPEAMAQKARKLIDAGVRLFMLAAEFSLDPWTLSNIHLQVQNYILTMVLGGVFDRHPNLIFGTAEFTGHWVGPLAENMDRFYGSTPFPSGQAHTKLKLKPSDYIRRNVRVACFDFEPVGTYISRYGFEDVFCYASDFPHHEGGKDPMNSLVSHLKGHSPEVFRKVFIDNGRSLLPD